METRKNNAKPPKAPPACKWVEILDDHPEWVEMCPWDELNVQDWVWMLERHPEHGNRCPRLTWQEFTGWHWADLLSVRPEFAERCDFSRLDAIAWELLLLFQPRFADRCDWAALPPDTQAAILSRHPELAACCTIRRMTLDRFERLAGRWAKDSRGLELELATLPDTATGPELPAARFFHWGRRHDLEGKALRDYAEWMRGPDAPDFLRRHAARAMPQVKSTFFSFTIENGHWKGDAFCEIECKDAPPDWNQEKEGLWMDGETRHDSPPLPMLKGPLHAPDRKDDGTAGFPAVDFLRWAGHHDIVRRTLRWRLRDIRDSMKAASDHPGETAQLEKAARLHPYATTVGVLEGDIWGYGPMAFCQLVEIDPRGRWVGWLRLLFDECGRHVNEIGRVDWKGV